MNNTTVILKPKGARLGTILSKIEDTDNDPQQTATDSVSRKGMQENSTLSNKMEELSNSDEENCNIPFCPKCGNPHRLRRSTSIHVSITPSQSPRRVSVSSVSDVMKSRSASALLSPFMTSSETTSEEVSTDSISTTKDSAKFTKLSAQSSPNILNKSMRKLSESHKKLMRSDSLTKVPVIEDEICVMQLTRSPRSPRSKVQPDQRLPMADHNPINASPRHNNENSGEFGSLSFSLPNDNNIMVQRKTSGKEALSQIPGFTKPGVHRKISDSQKSEEDEIICIKKLQKQRFREVVQRK